MYEEKDKFKIEYYDFIKNFAKRDIELERTPARVNRQNGVVQFKFPEKGSAEYHRQNINMIPFMTTNEMRGLELSIFTHNVKYKTSEIQGWIDYLNRQIEGYKESYDALTKLGEELKKDILFIYNTKFIIYRLKNKYLFKL